VQQIDAPVHHWQGLGARFAIYTNLALAERILGQAKMQRRIETRAEYVARRFRSEERDMHPLYAHLEFGHMLDFYCDESVSQWRQIAHSHGRSLLAPFVCRSVVGAALAVERRRRYLANRRIKYLLKDLLKRRVPTFDVDAQKAGGDLPFPRYIRSGPLMNAFDRYLMPDVVEPGIAAATREAPDWLTWNLLTLAIWRDEVLVDATLPVVPGTHVLAPSSTSGS
jgi:asparagine synthase (glutamine-hydrolysing)